MKYLPYTLLFSCLLLVSCNNDIPNNLLCNNKRASFIMGQGILDTRIACSNQDKMTGLMNIQSLDKDHGMIFVYDHMDYHVFWMKNTLIPLSIAYVDKDWIITDIKEMSPNDETHILPKSPALYAIEANKNWFLQHNVNIGDKVYIKL